MLISTLFDKAVLSDMDNFEKKSSILLQLKNLRIWDGLEYVPVL